MTTSQPQNKDSLSTGQQLAAHAAGGIGSWKFIGTQAAIMALWIFVNTLQYTQIIHFDTYPFVFLNLAMSAEAAFTGPILLIAANVAAAIAQKQTDHIEDLTETTAQHSEYTKAIDDKLDQHIRDMEVTLGTILSRLPNNEQNQ